MSQVLHLAHLVQHDRVAEVNVGRGGVETQLDAQRRLCHLRARKLGGNFRLDQELVGTTLENGELVFDVSGHCNTDTCARTSCGPTVC